MGDISKLLFPQQQNALTVNSYQCYSIQQYISYVCPRYKQKPAHLHDDSDDDSDGDPESFVRKPEKGRQGKTTLQQAPTPPTGPRI